MVARQTTLAPPSDDDEAMDFEAAQKMRLGRIQEVCATPGRQIGFVNTLIGATRANLTYCMTPRSANTFWLQMLRYSQRDFPDEVPQSPLDLDPRQIRTRPFIRTRKYNWKMLPETERASVLHSRIFLSVQDPYWRLWTTYLNAMTLPDLWTSVGARIEAKRPRVRDALKRKLPTPCGDSVTFEEFVQYVLKAYECDPCTLPFTYVIKAGTAKRDNRYILDHLNLTWAVDLNDVQSELRQRYIKTLVMENFDRLHDIRIQRCVTFGDLARRLWHSFVLQGILKDTMVIPEGIDDLHQTVFADKLVEMANQVGNENADKHKYMVAAFRHLNPATLKAVREKFDVDFKLFGYDPEPPELFS
ncbi:carbohydrate sulfotransferase [Elysia marginata]|uniref:Carbohydrate sulfotransferase n=1 Tax=Elysia marginata TaxID=1093978 RepID=A0AAV4FBK3_9GAST|nr:carbohydrate sulfotransferase [Elysia marginata]